MNANTRKLSGSSLEEIRSSCTVLKFTLCKQIKHKRRGTYEYFCVYSPSVRRCSFVACEPYGYKYGCVFDEIKSQHADTVVDDGTEQYFIVQFFCKQIVSIYCTCTALLKAFLLC